jgi:hypothetical protein
MKKKTKEKLKKFLNIFIAIVLLLGISMPVILSIIDM